MAAVLADAQSTLEAVCLHTTVPHMVVDIVATLVVATGMGSVVGFLEAPGRLACLDSILVPPCVATLLGYRVFYCCGGCDNGQ